MTATDKPADPITPDDLKASFQKLKDDIDTRADNTKSKAVPIAAAAAVAVVVVVFLIGRRVGKKKSTIVEIRRI